MLGLLVFGKHHQARGVAVEAMHDIYLTALVAATQVFGEDGSGGALLLTLGLDREQTGLFLYHHEVSIFIHQLEQAVAELMVALLTTDLYLHAWLEGEVILGSNPLVDKYDALAEQ